MSEKEINLLQYSTLCKQQKLQVISFIRRVYGYNTPIREIINGNYSAVCKQGMLTGVAFKLEPQIKNAKQ